MTDKGFAMWREPDGDFTRWRKRAGIRAASLETVTGPVRANYIIDRIARECPALGESVVVEVGSGSGAFARALSRRCKHVFAVEPDPRKTARALGGKYAYRDKPTNLTWICDVVERVEVMLRGRADVAICLTGSDVDAFRAACEALAPRVFMPWQDWNHGRAYVGGDGVVGWYADNPMLDGEPVFDSDANIFRTFGYVSDADAGVA